MGIVTCDAFIPLASSPIAVTLAVDFSQILFLDILTTLLAF